MSQNQGIYDYVSGMPNNDAAVRAGGQIVGGARPPSGLNPKNNDAPSFGHTTTQKNRGGMSSLDRKDKVMNLEQENNVLKEKKNLLETEVKKMETKLRRIEALMRTRTGISDQVDPNQL